MFKKLRNRIIWRRTIDFISRYQPQLIGITGSTGKTITREALALAVGGERAVRAATHSVSNPLDVALAILGVDRRSHHQTWFALLTGSFVKELKAEEPEIVLVEVGAHRPGEIDFLSQQLPWQVMIVTNVGTTHTQLFSSKEMVAHELTSAVVGLRSNSTVILNADDPLVMGMATKTRARIVTFGHAASASVRIARIDRMGKNGLAVTLQIAGRHHELYLPHVAGRHHVLAVAAAVAGAQVLGVDMASCLARLQKLVPPAGRLRMLSGKNNSIILDDSYSASPEVTGAALDTLKAFQKNRRIAVLGDMQDLGGLSQKAHAELGKHAAVVADMVIAVGEEMREAGKEALRAGADVHHFSDSGEVGKWLVDFIQPGDVILVAGSRGMQMENVVERLLANPERDTSKLVQDA